MQFSLSIVLAMASALNVLASPVTFSRDNNEASGELTKRYVGGSCRAHITQYQKNENGVGGNYKLDIGLQDASGAGIGGISFTDAIQGQKLDVYSQLPYVFEATVGGVDSDPIVFDYAGQHWDSNDGSRCSVGRYDSGNRDMDCEFSC